MIDPDPASAALIRRGRRVADYLRAECLAVYVSPTPDFEELTTQERESLERHLNFARGLQIETRVLQGADVAETVVNFARLHGVTQIFVTRQKSTRAALMVRRGARAADRQPRARHAGHGRRRSFGARIRAMREPRVMTRSLRRFSVVVCLLAGVSFYAGTRFITSGHARTPGGVVDAGQVLTVLRARRTITAA